MVEERTFAPTHTNPTIVKVHEYHCEKYPYLLYDRGSRLDTCKWIIRDTRGEQSSPPVVFDEDAMSYWAGRIEADGLSLEYAAPEITVSIYDDLGVKWKGDILEAFPVLHIELDLWADSSVVTKQMVEIFGDQVPSEVYQFFNQFDNNNLRHRELMLNVTLLHEYRHAGQAIKILMMRMALMEQMVARGDYRRLSLMMAKGPDKVFQQEAINMTDEFLNSHILGRLEGIEEPALQYGLNPAEICMLEILDEGNREYFAELFALQGVGMMMRGEAPQIISVHRNRRELRRDFRRQLEVCK